MLEEIRQHLAGTTSLECVEIVLFDGSALKIFQNELNLAPT